MTVERMENFVFSNVAKENIKTMTLTDTVLNILGPRTLEFDVDG
jgi:hypothetical protein